MSDTLLSLPLHPFLQGILVAPGTKAELRLNEQGELTSSTGDSFRIIDGIPLMLESAVEGDAHYREHYTTDAQEFDYFEEREDPATAHDEHRLYQSILRHVKADAQSVLDVGCGRAWVARELCPQGKTVCSMDISLTNPRKALQHYPYAKHCALVADAFHLPFADACFDCVIASEIIEHVPSPHAFVRELLRVVKPGGKLIVSTPYKERLRYVLCIHCNKATPLHAHIHSFDEKVLASLGGEQAKQAVYLWEVFGNKALLFLRTYVLLRFLPYALWRLVDRFANLIINKPAHIITEWKK